MVAVATTGESDTGCKLAQSLREVSLVSQLEELDVALPVSPVTKRQYILIIYRGRKSFT